MVLFSLFPVLVRFKKVPLFFEKWYHFSIFHTKIVNKPSIHQGFLILQKGTTFFEKVVPLFYFSRFFTTFPVILSNVSSISVHLLFFKSSAMWHNLDIWCNIKRIKQNQTMLHNCDVSDKYINYLKISALSLLNKNRYKKVIILFNFHKETQKKVPLFFKKWYHGKSRVFPMYIKDFAYFS